MFDFFKKSEKLGAPIGGKVLDNKDIPDETFAMEMVGKCIAIEPTDNKIYAPCDGKILMVFDTKHAITMKTKNGAELLIHIGIDTVKLKGEPFKSYVKANEDVKKGQLIMEVDLDMIKKAGYSTVTPMIICNTDDFKEIKKYKLGENVNASVDIIELLK